MHIEMHESEFDLWRVSGVSLWDAVAAFFADHGFVGSIDVRSVHRGVVQIEVAGDMPTTFSTNGQAHGTIFYRKTLD